MRRHEALTICIILLTCIAVFFWYNGIVNAPPQPIEVAELAPPSETLRTSLYENEFVEIGISHGGAEDADGYIIEDYIIIEGITHNPNKSYIMIVFENPQASDSEDRTVYQQTFETIAGEPFSIAAAVPATELARLKVQIYANGEEYGSFASWVYDSVAIVRGENWQFERRQDIYQRNYEVYMSAKSTVPDEWVYISDEVQKLSDEITADCATDYEKLAAIHDWVCSNIYYDNDVSTAEQFTDPDDILKSRRTKCTGYARLTRALVLAQGIPCVMAEGYALGIDGNEWDDEKLAASEANHDWNEAYVGERWVIIDNTWDSKNRYEGGIYETTVSDGYVYFDADLSFFSLNHSLIRYK